MLNLGCFSSLSAPRAPVVTAALVLLALGCREAPTSPTAPEPEPALAATAAAAALSFRQVSAGAYHSCGVTTDNRAYCWGEAAFGGLGRPSPSGNALRPVAVSGGLRFLLVNVGANYACGIATDRLAHCWGLNSSGQLGDGTTTNRTTPVAVAGGRRFLQLRTAYRHTCGVTTSNTAFCWGRNAGGELGDGTTARRLTPVRVAGGLSFSQVRVGGMHTCGETTSAKAYCWGTNDEGQLGDGTRTTRLKPVAVVGGLSFRRVVPGAAHTCGVTTGFRAYCWGRNQYGELGDGTTTRRVRPRAVAATSTHFDALALGVFHTCGVTTDRRAYCWGWNFYGQLGDGTNANRLTPVGVAGGLQFDRVSAGAVGSHTCGVTPSDVAYCWGRNSAGMLGDGTTTNRSTPVKVAGPM